MIASSSAFAIGDVEHDDRHFVQVGALRRAPAPLAGDDLEVVGAAGAHHDRLDDAALADRGGQFGELGVGEQLARIARIGAHVFDRHLALAARHALVRLRLGANVADQRSETATQSRTCCVVGHGGVLRTHACCSQLAARNSFSRWMISVASRR
jgi:hypothetical protein